MKKIKIIIGRAADGTYGAYAENVEGVSGMGNTAAEAQKEALEGLEIMKEMAPQKLPKWVVGGEYEVEYRFDVESLLNYYKGVFTNVGLERVTGINQRQLQHYASGLKTPRKEQREKISSGLHALAKELLTIEL